MKIILLPLIALAGVLANPIADPTANAEPVNAALAKRATCKFVALLNLSPSPFTA